MTNEEIKQAVEEYFNEMLSKDEDYLDHITDSWVYDAENWLLDVLEKQYQYNEYTPEVEEIVRKFWYFVQKEKDQRYDEKYGERDALFELDRIVCDVEQINKTFERIKHHFKKFNTYTEAVAYQFEELKKYLHLLDDIENDRVESLKEKLE